MDTPPPFKEERMATVAKVTTITARSTISFEDAVKEGVTRADKKLRNVSGAWIKEQKVEMEAGNVVAWQVTMEVTFVLDN
jgi:flavin-binding protein dodecin